MANRLAQETSPYLQQHAHNPVDWHPWDEQALALARAGDRPILLSVGYSACHWCHVMAHESFEDPDTAALMNRHFVNVKVDREERPDLDQVYQTAHQLIARRPGGWPLTMFLTPEGKPFFGGTYFPKRGRYGLPGFEDVLERVAELWHTRRADVQAQGDAVQQALAMNRPEPAPPDLLEAVAPHALRGLREALLPALDAHHGGFGGAPKFPQPAVLSALLRHGQAADDAAARDAVLLTVRRMTEGGLFDHLGGGYFRYSTDAQWTVPHFEKMLYDNGPLLGLVAQAWQLVREPLLRHACEATAAWLMREMQGPGGGFWSSIDADSEGEEGRYYLWRPDEVRAVLPPAEFAAFAARHGLDGPPNFEGRAWHLRLARALPEVAGRTGTDPASCEALIESARRRLVAVRETRVRPGRDEKVLTSWNALAIQGLAHAGRVFAQPAWAHAARGALRFVRRALWRDGRLLATHKDGRSHLNAYLDDHAFLLGAVIECMQGDAVHPEDVRFACELADLLLEQFEDRDAGGFWFTSHDHEALVVRPKAGQDAATPSGNGAAALHLQRLGHLVGRPRYLDAARRTMALFAADVNEAPHAYATLAVAMAEHATPPTTVVLAGPAETVAHWRAAVEARPRPGVLVLRQDGDGAGLPDALRKPSGERAQAWVCAGAQCLPVVEDLKALQDLLEGARVP